MTRSARSCWWCNAAILCDNHCTSLVYHFAPDWTKDSTPNPHNSELCPAERAIYCQSLQTGKHLDRTLSRRLLCLRVQCWSWLNSDFGSITSPAQLLLCPRWEAGGSSLSTSSAGSTKDILQKQLLHLFSHRFFSAITGHAFATKLNKPKYLFSFKIP